MPAGNTPGLLGNRHRAKPAKIRPATTTVRPHRHSAVPNRSVRIRLHPVRAQPPTDGHVSRARCSPNLRPAGPASDTPTGPVPCGSPPGGGRQVRPRASRQLRCGSGHPMPAQRARMAAQRHQPATHVTGARSPPGARAGADPGAGDSSTDDRLGGQRSSWDHRTCLSGPPSLQSSAACLNQYAGPPPNIDAVATPLTARLWL